MPATKMGRHSCCHKQKLKKGLWSPEEDEKLVRYITKYGHGCWSAVPKQAGAQNYAYNPDLCHAAALGSSSLISSSPCQKLSMSKSFIQKYSLILTTSCQFMGNPKFRHHRHLLVPPARSVCRSALGYRSEVCTIEDRMTQLQPAGFKL